MEFLGQSEKKGEELYKCKRLFNVREHQKPGENFIITASILRTTSVKDAWNLRFDIDPVTRKVLQASCSCFVGSTGKCMHSGALYKFINSERPTGKTDHKQQWSTPSRKAQERFPKGETVLGDVCHAGCDGKEDGAADDVDGAPVERRAQRVDEGDARQWKSKEGLLRT